MKKNFLVWGSLLGGLGVILGAFGAHALETRIDASSLESYNTAVRYQLFHALLLLFLSLNERLGDKLIFRLLSTGIILFSASIYLLSLKDLLGVEAIRYLGPITPIGGSLLIVAWAILFWRSLKLPNQ